MDVFIPLSWLAVQVESISVFLCESSWGLFLWKFGAGEPFRRFRRRRASCARLLRTSATGRPAEGRPFCRRARVQAASAISSSSFFFAPLAQLCHLGMPVFLPSTYTSAGTHGSPPASGTKAQ